MHAAIQELRRILEISHPGERYAAGRSWIDTHVQQCRVAASTSLDVLALAQDPGGLKRWSEEDALRRLGFEVAMAAAKEEAPRVGAQTLDRVWSLWVLL